MARKRFGIEFKGWEELIADYDKLGGEVKKIVEECLEVAPEMINPNLKRDMVKHKRTKDTEKSKDTVKSIVESPKVEWEGNIGKIPVGFNLKKGGMPSIFLMYGTARHAPRNQYGGAKNPEAKQNPGIDTDRKLYNDIYGTAIKRKIGEKQEDILKKAIEKRLGG